MKLIVTILSDIHLTTAASHPFAQRIDLIAAAIGSAEVAPHGILVLLGGDLADKGLEPEYMALSALLKRLREYLNDRFPGVQQYYASVPGNHDLFHAPSSEDYRRDLVAASTPLMAELRPNSFTLTKLLEPQQFYHAFAQTLSLPLTKEYSQLYETTVLHFGTVLVRLNFLNSALLSQRHEVQGSLMLPVPLLKSLFEDNTGSELTLTLQHHPLAWIESNNALDMRELFGSTSDYVLTGHQHNSSGLQASSDLGPNLKYYESPAFYDSSRPTTSAFRVLVFDLAGGREKQLLFRWDKSRYAPDSSLERSTDWSQLVRNRARRPALTMNAETVALFSAPGFAYVQNDRSPRSLFDIFVYPDLQHRGVASSGATQTIRAADVPAFLTSDHITLLEGAPLSGKTSLSRKLVFDARVHSNRVAIWIDGAALSLDTVAAFESHVYATFRAQYSKAELPAFQQLLPSQRLVIIDDWHRAVITPDLRRDVYEWLRSFCGCSVLIIDSLFQVKELVGTKKDGGSLANQVDVSFRRVHIGGLSNSSKAVVIHRWLASRKPSSPFAVEESKEAKKTEDLVSSLLGKDSLPPYAFFVLCILQALESRRTTALQGGSFGPLFEILILSALEKSHADDLQIALKLVLMQEMAFYMWVNRRVTITRDEVEDIGRAYTATHLQDMPVERFLGDLHKVNIVTSNDGNISFLYPHYLYYSVARYIRDHIEDDRSGGLTSDVESMIDNISSIENSTILMFLIYFEKNKHAIIDRIVRNAARIYEATVPANLDVRNTVFALTRSRLTLPSISADADVAENRRLVRERKDTAVEEEDSPGDVPYVSVHEAYGYNESLRDSQKLHLASQTTNALGQVIRNFSANLEGPRKVEVIKQTYLLGLRSLGRVLSLLEDLMEVAQAGDTVDEGDRSRASTRNATLGLISFIAQGFAVSVFYSISSQVGISDMELAYQAVLRELDQTIAVRMISITVQMNHFATFPERDIITLHGEIRENSFLRGILQWLVGGYLAVNPVAKQTREKMAVLFSFDAAKLAQPEIAATRKKGL